MTAEPWIFGIGAAKTGSNSLSVALRRFGLKASHLGTDVFNGDEANHSTMLKNAAENNPPTWGIFGMDAVMDYPVNYLFKEIDATVPRAKFILTYRPPDDCALSWCRMIARKPEKIKKDWPKGYCEYSNFVRQHNDEVLRHFLGRQDKLFILDCRDEARSIWKRLSNFLGLPMPKDTTYPKAFDHQKWEQSK